jgi:SpoIIAA-like
MIEFMTEGSGPVAVIRATGTLTGDDYKDVLIPRLDNLFGEYGKLRVVFYMDEGFTGWELGATLDDAEFPFKHRADFEKIAVVGGPDWVPWCIKFTAFLIAGEIRTYPGERLRDAWVWAKTA